MVVTTVILGAILVAVAASKLLDVHAVHSRFWTCRRRTETSQQTRFEKLCRYYVPIRNAASKRPLSMYFVTFDFDLVHTSFVVEIPEGSYWASVSYMHRTLEMCATDCEVLRAPWHWSGVAAEHPGPLGPERRGLFQSFGRLYDDASTPVSARLTTSGKGRQFYHVIASAVQDADIYFSLCSTPSWVRALYALAGRIDATRFNEYMIRRVLWVQLRTIFFKHDFWESHGRCTFFSNVYIWLPPAWVSRFEDWSQVVRSKVVLWLNYQLGTRLLGMRMWYREYELTSNYQQSKELSVVDN